MKIWPVLRATLLSTFGISAARWRYVKRRERLWEPLLILWAIGSAGSVFGYGLYRMALAMSAVGASLGQPDLALGMAIVSAQALVLFTGLFMVLSAFYFARDLRILVVLPISPGKIIAAKFMTLLVGEYLTISIVYFPALAGYAQYTTLGPGRLLVALLVFLAVPVLPLALASFVSLLLMRVVNRGRRDTYMVVASLLLIALIMGLQAVMIRAGPKDPQQYLMELISSRYGLLKALTRNFPPAFWATRAVHDWPASGGMVNLLLTIGASGAAIVALSAAGDRLFYGGLLGGEEVARHARAVRAGARPGRAQGTGDLLNRPSPPFRALVLREWVLFIRTPVWVLNGLAPALIAPAAILLPMLMRGELRQLLQSIQGTGGLVAIGLALAGFLMFMGSVNTIASTSISREGRTFWVSRTIPHTPTKQVDAKMAMALLTTLLATAPSLVIYVFLLRPPVLHIVAPAIIGLLGGLSGLAIGLRVDLVRPMLRWDDPQEPVKRNLNALLPMGVALAYFALGAAIYSSMTRAHWRPEMIYLALVVLTGAVSAVAWRNLRARAEEAYGRIEG